MSFPEVKSERSILIENNEGLPMNKYIFSDELTGKIPAMVKPPHTEAIFHPAAAAAEYGTAQAQTISIRRHPACGC